MIHRNINNLESVGITSNSNIYDNNSCFSPECSGVQVVDNGRVMNYSLNVLGVQNCQEIVSPDRSSVSLNDQCFNQSYGNEGCSLNYRIAGSSSSSPHVESLDSELQNVKDEQYVYTESSENQTRVDDMCQTLNDNFVTDTDILGLLDVSNDQIFNDFSHYVNTKCNFNWYLGVAAPDDYIYPDFTNNYTFDSSQSLATDCNDI